MRLLQFASNATQVLGPVASLLVSTTTVAPDGCGREGIVVNGQTPAPLIVAQKGDKFSINVFNDLPPEGYLAATSIHWHGIDQKNSSWSDGATMVTQCPIIPQQSFEYNFRVKREVGTYWYHSHWHTQYCDGLRGPLVIYDPDDPYRHLYDVDDKSTVITISDWYRHPFGPDRKNGFLPQSVSTLINGRGRRKTGPRVDLTTINVEQGKRYRFRLISMSCDPNYNFSIDGHAMTIIEADGNYVEPLTVDSIQIFAGQRYSVIVEAVQDVSNYWIRAIPNFGDTGNNVTGGMNAAIFRYDGAPEEEPVDTPNPENVNPLKEQNLHALISPVAPGKPFPGGVDKAITFDINFAELGDWKGFTLNNVTWKNPKIPIMLQILSGAHKVEELLPGGLITELPAGNKTIELTFIPPDKSRGDPHPVHLHGHEFSVVRSGGSDVWNFKNPVRRDVVSLGKDGGSGATIRFRTDNPGPWFLHCHIDFHLDAGFAAVLAVNMNNTFKDNSPVPYDWYNTCPVYYSSEFSDETRKHIPGPKGSDNNDDSCPALWD